MMPQCWAPRSAPLPLPLPAMLGYFHPKDEEAETNPQAGGEQGRAGAQLWPTGRGAQRLPPPCSTLLVRQDSLDHPFFQRSTLCWVGLWCDLDHVLCHRGAQLDPTEKESVCTGDGPELSRCQGPGSLCRSWSHFTDVKTEAKTAREDTSSFLGLLVA